jgi:hypothetical protein
MRTIRGVIFFIIAPGLFAFILIKTAKQYPKADHATAENFRPRPLTYPDGSWPGFLQHLPTADQPIVDYKGNQISNQEKHFAILTYDVGSADLQQCADALIRIRSEYLFSQKKYSSIGFHFNSGIFYSWQDYLQGLRPSFKGRNQILMRSAPAAEISHFALRKYLDIVYAYANTVSLCRELKSTDRFETGTVIIYPGHPGHCCMIIDAATVDKQDTVFKMVEGYMPAQSIYVLSNPFEPEMSPWYHLGKGDINTASCSFRSYFLKKFE